MELIGKGLDHAVDQILLGKRVFALTNDLTEFGLD